MISSKEALGAGSLHYTPNAHNRPRGGFVQIVFSPDAILRPVQKVYRGGRAADRTTYQSAFEGDYILRREWYPECEKLYRVVGDEDTVELVPDHADSGYLMSIVSEALEKVEGFMVYGGGGGTYIPTGEAWDGVNTVSSDRKRLRIEGFWAGLPPPLLKRVLDASRISASSGMPRNWNDKDIRPVAEAIVSVNPNAFWTFPDPDCEEGSWVVVDQAEMITTGKLRMKPDNMPKRAATIMFWRHPTDPTREIVTWTLYRN